MKQYIDKDALKVEIRKRLLPVIRDRHYDEWEEGQDSERQAILGIIDNLEVKEMDYIPMDNDFERDAVNFCHDNGLNTTPRIAKTIAKHFFELGLKTRTDKEFVEVISHIGSNKEPVGPRFHEGDWVVDNQFLIHQIERVVENVTTHTFAYDIVGGGYFNDNTEGVRLWSINDARDGDVLAAHECLVIFKEIDGLNIKCYCTYHHLGFNKMFFTNTLQNKDAFQPATKDECDILMKAVADSGYTFENKELKKIEQKYIDKCKESEDEKIKAVAIEFVRQNKSFNYHLGISKEEVIAWLEKQWSNPYSGVSFEYNGHTWGICARDNGVEILVDGEIKERVSLDKAQCKSPLEAWKDMRLEVYQQASGNRHEPNCSDDTTKMFSLNDIDEIFEKICEYTGKDELKSQGGSWVVTRYGTTIGFQPKQGEKLSECRQGVKPNGGIVCEDFNDGQGHYKVNLAYLSRLQVELIEKLVDSWQPTNNECVWNEKDEELFGYALDMIEWYSGENENKSRLVSDWLKSLKDRIQTKE